jgi:hypothetical protein
MMNDKRMDEWLSETKLGFKFGYWDAVHAMNDRTLQNTEKGKKVFGHIGMLLDELLRDEESE